MHPNGGGSDSYGLGYGKVYNDPFKVLLNAIEFGKLETVGMRMSYRCLIILIDVAPRALAAARCCRSNNASIGTGMMCNGTRIRMWPGIYCQEVSRSQRSRSIKKVLWYDAAQGTVVTTLSNDGHRRTWLKKIIDKSVALRAHYSQCSV